MDTPNTNSNRNIQAHLIHLKVLIMARTKQIAPRKHETAAKTMAKQPKARRFRPGTVALREVKRYQRSTNLLIPQVALNRLIREVTQDIGKRDTEENVRYQSAAVLALQEASEAYLVSLFETADRCRLHAGRETVITADMKLAGFLHNQARQHANHSVNA